MSAFDGKADEQSTQFDIDVIEYTIDGEITSLEAHIFTLEIWLNQEPYRIRRSYKEICDFDVHLNKQYPKTTLPPCPLSTSFSSSLQSAGGEKKGGIRSSFVNLKNTNLKSINRRNSLNDLAPDISHKKPALLSYLKLLLLIPEIVRSTNMVDFLDMASSNGEGYEEIQINLMDMLLDGTTEKSVNIMKKHSVKFEVIAGQYLVWTFSTKKRDLGFSININDNNVLTYQRYNCHEHSISNVLKCPVDGLATLEWDNTYSKLRTKHLMFRCKVLSSDLYKEHSKHCVDLSREQQVNHSRRSALQRALVQKSHQLLSSQGGRLISQDFTVDMTSGDKVVHEDLQEEICTLNEQKSSLQNALSESEIALADIRQELAVMKKILDKNKTVTEELERVSSERDELQQEIQDECMSKKKLEIDLQAVMGDLVASQEKFDTQMNQNQADAHAFASLQHQQTLLHDENSQLVAEIALLKTADRSGGGGSAGSGSDSLAQIQRLKAEKKQLKAYAISLKGQLESFEKEKKTSTPQLPDSSHQLALSLVQKMTPLLATLEAEVRGLQGLRDQYVSRGGESSAGEKEKETTGTEVDRDDLLTRTTSAMQSGMDTADTVSVMLKYADMKLGAIDSMSTSSSSSSSSSSASTATTTTSSNNTTSSTETSPVKISKKTMPAAVSPSPSTSAKLLVPEHTGSVFAPMVSVSPPPSSTTSIPSSPTKCPPSPNGHPATCNCMKCTAPPKRPSMMESVINTFLDVEESVDSMGRKLSTTKLNLNREEKR